MAQSQDRGNRPIAMTDMKLRELGGGSVGVTIDRNALEDLGLVDDDGQLSGDVWVRQLVREDGTVEMNLKDE